MRNLLASRVTAGALSVSLALLAQAPSAAADPLSPGEAANGWAPSFTFFAAAASAPSEPAAAPPALPAPISVAAPGCTDAVADDCITTIPEHLATRRSSGASMATASDPTLVATSVSTVSTDGAEPVVVATNTPDAAPGEPVATIAIPRTSEAPRRDESTLWVPSVSVFGGALIQNADSTVASGPLFDPFRLNSHPQFDGEPQKTLCLPEDPITCIRPSASGSDRQVTPFVMASAELMSPALRDVPGLPRGFAHVDAALSFSRTRNIAREAVPGEVMIDPSLGDTPTSPLNVFGQGSQTSSWVKSLLLSGGLGVAFTADIGERRLRIKPSVEYLWEKVQVEGQVTRVARESFLDLDPDEPPPPPIVLLPPTCTGTDLEDCRVIQLSGKDHQVFQGVGPGLELEMDAARAGPVILSLYSAAAAYRMMGDLTMEFSDTQRAAPNFSGDSNENAVWTYEKDPWAYRAGVGLRFRYAPED